jgi:aconitate hydratase
MREADYTDVLELDLATVEPSLAGPKRPQDRVPLRTAKDTYRKTLVKMAGNERPEEPGATGKAPATVGGKTFEVPTARC